MILLGVKLTRKLQKTPKGQFCVTVPKQLVQLLGWKEQDKIRFKLVDGNIIIEKEDDKK